MWRKMFLNVNVLKFTISAKVYNEKHNDSKPNESRNNDMSSFWFDPFLQFFVQISNLCMFIPYSANAY